MDGRFTNVIDDDSDCLRRCFCCLCSEKELFCMSYVSDEPVDIVRVGNCKF